MNVALNALQGNTIVGDTSFVGNVDFTGKENLLAKLGNNSGVANLYLPTAATDTAFYVVMSGDAATNSTAVQVPTAGEQCRVRAYGTGVSGDALVIADPTANAGAQAGMVRSFTGSHAPSASSGTYFRFGYAEESFVDGQNVLARFIPGYIVS